MHQKQDIFTIAGGRAKFHRTNYNPTSDAVWLAAAATRAKNILDVGIGTGGVAMLLNGNVTGIDISDKMLADAAANAELNGRKIELINADIMTWRTVRTFDLVVTNPPYFRGTAARHNAHHNADIYKWTRACLRRVRPRGCFCTIVDAAVLDRVIAALHDGAAGDIEIIPLFGARRTAERVIIRARLGVRGGARIHSGFDMNDERILRDGLTVDDLFTSITVK